MGVGTWGRAALGVSVALGGLVIGAAPAPAAATAGVTIGDNFFQAKTTTVAAGTTVTWDDTGANPHTVTADDGSFDSSPGGTPTLANGQSFSTTFSTPGSYPYHCRIHGAAGGVGMSGTIVVTSTAQKPVTRIAGADRIATAVAASVDSFPSQGSAGAAVLATASDFPDALAGTPLAVAKHGPLLVTGSSALDSRVGTELQRVLPAGHTVYVLGGSSALNPSIDADLQGRGYHVVRYQGTNRFQTAVAIASGLGDPTNILEATGFSAADALSGGAAAGIAHAAILLTSGSTQSPDTATYLSAHSMDARVALGGPAAAADPAATPIVGADRYETSTLVARHFFSGPAAIAVASGQAASFADGLSGGADIASRGGPLLLVQATAPLPASVGTYLHDVRASVASGRAFGGPAVVGDDVIAAVDQQISAP